MRVARVGARSIGWLFVIAIGYHAVLAGIQAARAGSDDHWSYAAEMATLALAATAIVIAAVLSALHAASRPRER